LTGLIFIGMVGPYSHNREEQRFVEELSRAFGVTYYLQGAGIKGLRVHQLRSIPGRIAHWGRKPPSSTLRHASLAIIPFRHAGHNLNAAWLTHQLEGIIGGSSRISTLWIRFPSPELVGAVEHLRHIRVVYEPIDLYAAADDLSPDQARRLTEAEQRLIKRATVVTGGRQLAERFRHACGGSTWLPFGFDREQPDSGLGIPPTIPRPRIGLVGCLDWRVDESLLVAVMAENPNWHLVLAGPRVDPWGRRLKRLANVHWLDRIPVERVRPVIRDCQVTLVPYRQTDWTRHCLPVKVFEYLAEGKSVVATHLPELEILRDVVTMASPESFGRAIERALFDDRQSACEERRVAAHRFTLQGRAQRAIELINGKKLQTAAR
jgi:glycosyltransferase involved in cell wall biosynthesis